MFLLYNILLTLFSPLWVPWMWLRTRRRQEPVNWEERVGIYKLSSAMPAPRLWLHAVSVGEVIAAKPILKEIRARLPHATILVSVTTSSGHQTAIDQLQGLHDHLVYIPIDVVRFQWRAMATYQPTVVAIMETELWMNFLTGAKEFGAKTLIVNGRISDKNWRLSRHLRFFYRALFKRLDRVLVQTEGDRKRFSALGAAGAEVFGNTKFDQASESAEPSIDSMRKSLHVAEDRQVVVIGSTRSEMEEALVIEAIRLIGSENLTVIHAPRHIERASALGSQVQAAFGAVAYRSRGETGNYLVLDTYGELAKVYAIADVVIVGGGFDRLGGQNILQPMALAKPVLHGPNMHNFRDVAKASQEAGASIACATAEDLAENLKALLADPARRLVMGTTGKALIDANRGASQRYAEVICTLMEEGERNQR